MMKAVVYSGHGADRVIAHELESYGSCGMAPHEYPRLLALIADGKPVPRPDSRECLAGLEPR